MADESQETRGLRAVCASEILAKIEKGDPVEYDGVIINGNLDLKSLDLCKTSLERSFWFARGNDISEILQIIATPLSIKNSQIKDDIIFDNIIFRCPINFNGSIFNGEANFAGSYFENGAVFEYSRFIKPVSFSFSKFRKPLNLKGSKPIKIGLSQVEGKFEEANFRGCQFQGDVKFIESVFGPADFSNSRFAGHADFKVSVFEGFANFCGSKFEGITEFWDVQFNGFVFFTESFFCNETAFSFCKFNDPVEFSLSKFLQITRFYESCFNKDVEFRGSSFKKTVTFGRSEFHGEILSFRDTVFKDPRSQEDACRRAKNILEKNGDREEAGYHFYREMEGKRKQKPWHIRCPEYVFIQMIFGYGVHPLRLIAWWSIIVATFAAFYWIGSGINGATNFFDYFKFSLATAIAPGYIATIISPGSTGYKLAAFYQAVAIIESIFGTFLWAGFIATFAKKYMR